jgi:carbon-monoxide dehydrogenase large subunit
MTDTATRPTAVIGQRLLRREDPALLTGEARFTNDLDVPGALFLAVARSPYAHARISSVDTSAAAAADGVVAVYSGADLAGDWAAPMPCAWPVTDDMKNPQHYPLATDKVCYVGDGVAAVLATSERAARDAVDLLDVTYEPLEAVIDLADALSDRVVIHDDLGTNRSYTWALKVEGEEGQVDAAFAAAAHTVKQRYVQQRLIPMAMEPRSVVVVPQPFGGDLTLYSTTQIPHILKIMSAITLGLPEHQVRVVAPAVGGGFGSKLNVYAEELLCMALAKRHGVPVRWQESRTENALATIHGRGQIQDIELAADADGKLTAVRVRLLADMGAYLQLVTPGIPLLGAFLYGGVYDLPTAYDFECTSVFTTMTPTDAYRGAGRPEATYAIERAMDALAGEIGIDPLELRRRNYIPTAAYPYTAWSGLVYDSGDHPAAADKAAAMVGYDALRQRQREQNVDGATKRLGIGVSSYFEMCGLAPSRVLASLNYAAGGWEAATVRVLPTAKVQVVTGTAPHGQGHETAWSMIVAEQLGISPDDVDVLHSDTAIAPLGMDTYGSRSLPVGGVAIAMACDRVVDKARQIAAHQLEANADDLQYEGGAFTVAGSPDKTMPLAAIAFEAFTAHNLPDGMEPNLEAHVTYDPPNFSWPFGTHMCVVEVDTETGAVDVLDYAAVDDCGVQVNPLIVEGQVHGGVVQGLAQALFEEAVFDADGNPQTSTLADYLVPAASDVPALKLDHTVTPSPTNPLGVKGIGEAGTIGAAPAVINAIADALSGLGVRDVPMPASPQTVWNVIQEASRNAGPEAAGAASARTGSSPQNDATDRHTQEAAR